MKLLAFVVLSVLATLAVSDDPKCEFMKRFETAKEACKDKTGVTEEDLHALKKKQVPQTKTGQCFAACAGKDMGVITDNKINMVQVKALSAEFKDKHPKMYNGSMKIIAGCAEETDTDDCVAAKKIMDCLKQGFDEAKGEFMKKFGAAKKVCKEKTGATKEDLRTLWKKEVPQTKTGQCFAACAGKEMGVITDNKINMEQVKALSAKCKDKDPERHDKMIKVMEGCVKETDTDACVAAKKIMDCVKEGADKNGITKKA